MCVCSFSFSDSNVVGNTKAGLTVGVTFTCVALSAIIVLIILIYRSGKCQKLWCESGKDIYYYYKLKRHEEKWGLLKMKFILHIGIKVNSDAETYVYEKTIVSD